MDPWTIVLEEINYFKYLSEQRAKSKRSPPPQIAHPFTIQQRCKSLRPQTYEEICIRGLKLFVTHSKKKKKKRNLRYVGSLGPSAKC